MNRRRFLAAAAAAGSAAKLEGLAGAVLGGAPASAPGASPAGGPLAANGISTAGYPTALAAQANAVTGIDYFPVYYAWYSSPARWVANPDYHPALGRYLSRDPLVVDRHLEALQAHGGAGFAVNWHGAAGFVHDTVAQHLLPRLAAFPGLELCIHYDPFIRWGLPMPDFARDAAAAALWRDDARYLARSFMSTPQYARVDGRPLLFVYLSRAIEGRDNLAAFVDIAREEAAAAGHPGLYLVLGEAWWIPAEETPVNLEIIRSRRAPRTRLADAVYSYNLATEPVYERVWRGNVRTFLGEASRVYKDYRNLMDQRGAPGTGVVTTLMPRFDNTLLRQIEGGAPGMNIGPWRGFDGIDFAADVTDVFDSLTTSLEPVRDGRALMLVTSWNEWPERSALEPTGAGVDKDGLPLPGDAYLRALAEAVAAFPADEDAALRPERAPGRLVAGAETGAARAPGLPRRRLASIDLAVGIAGLTAVDTEDLSMRQVTGGRRGYRRLLAAGGS